MRDLTFKFLSNQKLMRLNFDSREQVRFGSLFLLIFGCLILSITTVYVYDVAKKTSRLKSQIQISQQHYDSFDLSKTSSNRDPEQAELLEKILKQINFPWDDFFNSFESVNSKKISILSIQPNTEAREAIVLAEAENLHEMFEYVRLLNSTPSFKQVELLNQVYIIESNQNSQDKRIGFEVMVKMHND